jgi:hypothetical protein
MDTYRETATNVHSKDSVTKELRRFVRRTAPRESMRKAAIAVAATVPLTDSQRTAKLMGVPVRGR